jgi:uncharacterized protein YbjQ (UPF0145 family)
MAKAKGRGKPASIPGLSDLSVTEFVTLARMGFYPRGLVIGCAVFDAGSTLFGVDAMAKAMHTARALAVSRMREQAAGYGGDGVVGVRLDVEHHRWRGGHVLARFLAVGTAVAFDKDHAPGDLVGAPSLRLQDGGPFTSDLSGQDFVALLRAGYRPITIAMGNSVVQVNTSWLAGGLDPRNYELTTHTQAFFDARETAMDQLDQDLFRQFPKGSQDAPIGVVGMTVDERPGAEGVAVVEFSAIGTAIAALAADDPRRASKPMSPRIVVPLDR